MNEPCNSVSRIMWATAANALMIASAMLFGHWYTISANTQRSSLSSEIRRINEEISAIRKDIAELRVHYIDPDALPDKYHEEVSP